MLHIAFICVPIVTDPIYSVTKAVLDASIVALQNCNARSRMILKPVIRQSRRCQELRLCQMILPKVRVDLSILCLSEL